MPQSDRAATVAHRPLRGSRAVVRLRGTSGPCPDDTDAEDGPVLRVLLCELVHSGAHHAGAKGGPEDGHASAVVATEGYAFPRGTRGGEEAEEAAEEEEEEGEEGEEEEEEEARQQQQLRKMGRRR